MKALKFIIAWMWISLCPFMVGGVVMIYLMEHYHPFAGFVYVLVWMFIHVGLFDGSSLQRSLAP
jgi:hypothetical protein